MIMAIFLLMILLLISLFFSDQAIARDTITPTQPLADNETLISGDGTFALGFFSPGSSKNRYVGLWYNKHKERTVVWVANRKNPVTNSSTGVLSISNEGNLVITNQINSTVVWSSGTTTNVSNPVAQLLNTGNLVVRDAYDGISYAWQGFNYPTDTMLAGMKVGVDLAKTKLDCKNGKDGFHVIYNTKLADTLNASVYMNLSLVDCRTKCWTNCSCTAYAPSDVRNGGSGCIIWTSELTDLRVFINDSYGQVLYVRLAAIDLGQSSTSSGKSSKWVNAFLIILVSMMLILAILAILYGKVGREDNQEPCRRATIPSCSNQGFASGNDHLELSQKNDLELPLLDFGTIVSATENFSAENKLGEGGFGPVYMGRLGDGQEIAVKRLAKSSVQGLVEFRNEVVLIAKLQHRNLVRLLGCSIKGEERLLVYEYMPNKSLDFFLFGKPKEEGLDWQTRFKIIMGISRGLLYLHQDSRLRVIHRDLKASNILLDKDMNPKISDFGMARIFGGDEVEGNTRKVVGTYGYMSPEYAMDGIFSQKSDVFSFGVLVLEIITGKKNRGEYLAAAYTNLLDHVWNSWKEGNSLQMIDESMGYSYPMNEVMSCIKVGLLCVQNHPEDRPLMPSVIFMLRCDNTLLPYPKEPGFAMRSVPYRMESSSSKTNSSSMYDVSVTQFEPR